MKKVKSFDGITLDYELFISSEFDLDNYIGSKTTAINGSTVMFIQPKGAFTKEVKIYSKENGWVHEDRKALLADKIDELPKNVIFNDGSSDVYYLDHTKTPMAFTSLYEGSAWYSVEINLVKG